VLFELELASRSTCGAISTGAGESGNLPYCANPRNFRRLAAAKEPYDARGNWVTKAVESRPGADLEFALASDERRTLAYFG
jgi:hypothetical protein